MAKSKIIEQVEVCLPEHRYSILICSNGLNDPTLLQNYIKGKQVCIVTNDTVAPLYLSQVEAIFSSYQCDVVILPDGEQYKNQSSLFKIYDTLIKNKHHRDTHLVALGGGVIGDMAGFAAATYQRGVNFIQIPTTLLAQIDASVGGKTAINHPMGKNLIGSFYQPQLVLIDLNTLHTLPEREFRAGLAEMIKYALLAGGEFFNILNSSLKKGLTASSPELAQLIKQCCQIKANIVMSDEKEQGQRALLNLGHTFAHALETYTAYQRWLHGEAVAIGLYCAALLSFKLKILDECWVKQTEEMLIQAGLPHKIPDTIQLEKLIEVMGLDKKIKNNCLRFVVMKKPGYCYLEDNILAECLMDTLIAAVHGE